MADFSPPLVDFYSKLSGLGDIIADNKKQNDRKAALATANAPGVSYGDAIRGLVSAGALPEAQLYATQQAHQDALNRQTSEDAHRTGREAVEDKFRSAQLDLSRRAAERADEDKFVIKEITDANGNVTGYQRINTKGPEGLIASTARPQTSPTNPFSDGGKFNGDQAKAAGFADRTLAAEGILTGIDGGKGVIGANTPTQYAIERAPIGDFGRNGLHSAEFQKYSQAQRDFVNAQLRRESGAAISQGEFDSANKQYFPLPNDTEEVIKQKNANRRTAIAALAREAGNSYKPQFVFDQNGGVITNKPAAPPNSKEGILAQARDAISRGAPKDAVATQLKGIGIDPGAL